MAENVAPAAAPGSSGDIPGQAFYDKARQHLRDLLQQRRILERNLAMQEDQIYKRETDYLEDTPSGNIIMGFEGYTKGTGPAAPGAGRRKGAVSEMNRVFSRSSITFNVNAESPLNTSAQSTPVAAIAPTPIAASFMKGDGPSNHATPTSATSASRSGAGNKKGRDDSETDTKEVKKARTGVVARK